MLLGTQSVCMELSKHKGRNTSISHLNAFLADFWEKSAFKFWTGIRASRIFSNLVDMVGKIVHLKL